MYYVSAKLFRLKRMSHNHFWSKQQKIIILRKQEKNLIQQFFLVITQGFPSGGIALYSANRVKAELQFLRLLLMTYSEGDLKILKNCFFYQKQQKQLFTCCRSATLIKLRLHRRHFAINFKKIFRREEVLYENRCYWKFRKVLQKNFFQKISKISSDDCSCCCAQHFQSKCEFVEYITRFDSFIYFVRWNLILLFAKPSWLLRAKHL